ncbi:hypothetical protein KI387_030186, partial [Taxus chinensis]
FDVFCSPIGRNPRSCSIFGPVGTFRPKCPKTYCASCSNFGRNTRTAYFARFRPKCPKLLRTHCNIFGRFARVA